VRPVRNTPTFLPQALAASLASAFLAGCSVYSTSLLESGPVTDNTMESTESTGTTSGTTSNSPPSSTPTSQGTGPGPAASLTSGSPTVPATGTSASGTGTTVMPPATNTGTTSTGVVATTAPVSTDPAVPGSTGPAATDSTAPSVPPEATGGTPEEPSTDGPVVEVPSDDPLIDDFEDGSEQLPIEGSREGFWFARGNSSDDGTITDIEEAFVALTAGDNQVALHVVAKKFTATDTWAVFGANFNDRDPAPAYIQAAQYDGLHFWACGGLGASKVALEVATTDTSSAYDHQDNHYRKDLSLTASWKEFVVPWDDLRQTWGDMTDFDAEHVLGLQFNISSGQEGFDVWLDDLEFIDAGGSNVTAPRTGACPSSAPPAAADAGAPAADAG
jgi:Carbohydrate binding domain (family 11)